MLQQYTPRFSILITCRVFSQSGLGGIGLVDDNHSILFSLSITFTIASCHCEHLLLQCWKCFQSGSRPPPRQPDPSLQRP